MSISVEALDSLRQHLPPVFSRRQAAALTGGLVAPGTLANADSRGEGPAGMFYVNRRACYRREPFLDWLAGRMSEKRGRKAPGQSEPQAQG